MDNRTAKENQQKTWQAVAPGWKRWGDTLRRYSQPVTDRMVAGIRPGQRVLDIASGVGDPAITIASLVGPTGSVLGTDLVEEMLTTARENAASRGVTNIEFRRADGEEVDVPAASFDVVTMRWGLMFMPDPGACLTGAKRALKPGGTLVLTCWAAPQRNPWASIPMAVIGRHIEVPTPPPGTPGLFAFADPARLRSVIESAGFSDVTIEEVTITMADFATGDEYLRFILDLAGPVAGLFSKVPEGERAKVSREIAAEVVAAGGGQARLPGVTWLATARA